MNIALLCIGISRFLLCQCCFFFFLICCPWLWAEGRAELAARIGPTFLSQRPTVTAPVSFVARGATSLCPSGVLNQSLWHLTSGLHLPQENMLPLGLEQHKTTFPSPSSPSELLIWPLFLFIHPMLSAIHFSGILQHLESASGAPPYFPMLCETDVCICPWSSQLDAVTRWLLVRVFIFLVTLIWTSSSFSKNTVSEQNWIFQLWTN